MTTAINSRRRLPVSGIAALFTATLQQVSRRLRDARRHREGGAQLANLPDRLRQDIGLADSSPTAAELIERFHRARQPPPREHESRYRIWA